MNKYIIIFIVLVILLIYSIFDYYKTELTLLSKKHKPTFINFIQSLDKSSKKLFIIPHLELGDCIVANGAVRYYCSIYDTVIMSCKESYHNQILFMYSDVKNLILYSIPDKNIYRKMKVYVPYNLDPTINKLFLEYNITYLPMGCFNSDLLLDIDYFPNRIYNELKLDVNIAYSHFKIIRDYDRENELYNELVNTIGSEYIVVIDDEKRNFLIDDKYLTNLSYPIFKLGNNSYNKNKKLNTIRDPIVFNYIKILENAKEILSIDSSIPWIIDMLDIQTPTTVHSYSRLDRTKYNNKNINIIQGTLIQKYTSVLNFNNYTPMCAYRML